MLAAVAWVIVRCGRPAFAGLSKPTDTSQRQAAGSRSTSRLGRGFFGDIFKQEVKEEEELEFPDTPGRGGAYAPAGFDTKSQIFQVYQYPHPALRLENKLVDTFDARLKKFSRNLFETMYALNGEGLAAPQVGVNLRMMVYNWKPKGKSEEVTFINPKILRVSDKIDTNAEACLSFARIKGLVARPVWVEIEAVDWDGNPFQRRLEGYEARVFMHEYDHLEGVVFVDQMSDAGREKIQPDLKFMMSDYASCGGVDARP